MKSVCAWCGTELGDDPSDSRQTGSAVSHGICASCRGDLLSGTDRSSLEQFLDRLEIPVLLVDDDVEILHANQSASRLLGKDLSQLRGVKGGNALSCANADLPGGCGNTVNCEACVVRSAVEKTYATGESHREVRAKMDRRAGGEVREFMFRVSTEKAYDAVLLRIEEEEIGLPLY